MTELCGQFLGIHGSFIESGKIWGVCGGDGKCEGVGECVGEVRAAEGYIIDETLSEGESVAV